MTKVELKRVITPDGEQDLTVEVVPFNRRNDDHVDFAFAYMDMLGRVPSKFANVSEAARGYVDLFMAHKEEDAVDANSSFACVRKDVRASRVLFHQPKAQKELQDFFGNA